MIDFQAVTHPGIMLEYIYIFFYYNNNLVIVYCELYNCRIVSSMGSLYFEPNFQNMPPFHQYKQCSHKQIFILHYISVGIGL